MEKELLSLPELATRFSEVRIAQSLDFCVVFGSSLFVLFLFAIIMSVRRFVASY